MAVVGRHIPLTIGIHGPARTALEDPQLLRTCKGGDRVVNSVWGEKKYVAKHFIKIHYSAVVYGGEVCSLRSVSVFL